MTEKFFMLGLFSFAMARLCALEDIHFKINDTHEFYLSQRLDADELLALQNEPFLAISLGHTCWPASHLQDHALRKRSFPFDWMITSFESLYQILETDFYGFLDIQHMHIGDNENKISDLHGGRFVHDFETTNWLPANPGIAPVSERDAQEYEAMLLRYERRIARFYKIFELGIPIYLIRWQISQEQADKLYNLLTRKFPNGTIYLICLETSSQEKCVNEEWGHPHIRHFTIGWDDQSLSPIPDRSRHPEWTRVFQALGLLRWHWNCND
jgi:hypothetical protein